MDFDEKRSAQYFSGRPSSADLERIREKNDQFMKLTRVFLEQSRKLKELAETGKKETER